MLQAKLTGGWDFLQKLKANEPIVVRSSAEAIPLLVNGERPLNAQSYGDAAWEAKLKNEPIEINYPEEGVVVSHDYTGILKSAPHPNAAKVFVDYLFSQENAQWLVDHYVYVTHPAVKPPAGFKPLNGAEDADPRRRRRRAADPGRPRPVLRRLRRLAWDGRQAGWPLAGLLAFLVLYPIGWLVLESIRDEAGGFTLAHYRAAATSPAFRTPALNSFILATSVGLLSVLDRHADGVGHRAHRHAGPRAHAGAGLRLGRHAGAADRAGLDHPGRAQRRRPEHVVPRAHPRAPAGSTSSRCRA